jgi:diguanylate cyclase (GGDEF)-like protein/PAS domain S-box-containing protein
MLDFIIALLILSGTLMVVLSITAFQRRSSPLALSFAATVLCAGIWDFGFAAEILSPTLEEKIFWANLKFLGITFLPVTWLAMTMYSTAQPRQNLRVIPALAVVSTITNLIIWTNPYHHVFRQNPSLNAVGVPFPVLVNDFGAYFYAIHIPFGDFLFAASLYILIHSWKQTPIIYRRQRITLMLSLFFPLLVDTLYILGITPIPAFNFTPIVFSLSGLLLGVNVLYIRFLDVVPLAYEAAVNGMNVGVIVLDASGLISYLNPAAEKIIGSDNEQIIGLEARQVIQHLKPLWDSTNGHAEIMIPHGSDDRTYQIYRTPLMRGNQRLIGQIITLDDITGQMQLRQQLESDIAQRKRAEETLKESELRYRAVAQSASESIVSANSDGQIVGWNHGAEITFGYSETEALGQSLTMLMPVHFREEHQAGMERVLSGGEKHVIGKTVELQGLRRDGSEFPIEMSLAEWQASGGKFYTAIIRDITERKQAEEELRRSREEIQRVNVELETALVHATQLARTDTLTGVNNRRYLFELAEQAFAVAARYQQTLSVIMFDIDHFKKVNDTFGHAAGDLALQKIAQVVCAEIRATDVIGRYGGEEFVVILPMTDAQHTYQLGERIREAAAAASVPTPKGDVAVTLSIGIAEMLHSAQFESAENMINRADKALYAAKQAGRNRTVIATSE